MDGETISREEFDRRLSEATEKMRQERLALEAENNRMQELVDQYTTTLERLEDMAAGVLIQKQQPDAFFTAEQHKRLQELRQQRDSLNNAGREEWVSLVNAELDATVARTNNLPIDLKSYF